MNCKTWEHWIFTSTFLTISPSTVTHEDPKCSLLSLWPSRHPPWDVRTRDINCYLPCYLSTHGEMWEPGISTATSHAVSPITVRCDNSGYQLLPPMPFSPPIIRCENSGYQLLPPMPSLHPSWDVTSQDINCYLSCHLSTHGEMWQLGISTVTSHAISPPMVRCENSGYQLLPPMPSLHPLSDVRTHDINYYLLCHLSSNSEMWQLGYQLLPPMPSLH